ncbi:protein of unknown function [Pseudomonas mediterranea]
MVRPCLALMSPVFSRHLDRHPSLVWPLRLDDVRPLLNPRNEFLRLKPSVVWLGLLKRSKGYA